MSATRARLVGRGDNILAGLVGKLEPFSGVDEMIVRSDGVGRRGFVAVPREQPINGEAPDLQSELGVSVDEVPAGASQRARLGASGKSKLQGEIEEAGIFGSGEPEAAVGTVLRQVVQDGTRVAARILFADRSKGGETGRGGGGSSEGIFAIGLVGAADVEQDLFTRGIDGTIRLIQAARGFGVGEGVVASFSGDERADGELAIVPERKAFERQEIQQILQAVGGDEAGEAGSGLARVTSGTCVGPGCANGRQEEVGP